MKDASVIDKRIDEPAFFRGMGYSPYLPGETPLFGAPPGDDARYVEHLRLMREMGVNYLHVFPLLMPQSFFTELDKHDLVYGQDIWVMGGAPDYLDEAFLTATITQIKAVIDHTYSVGRQERLVLFSIGDELHADAIKRTDTRHPEVRDFTGKHIVVSGRTPTEVALARLIDAAIGSSPRSLRDRALVELLYGAGLRVSETVGLEKGSVALEERIVRVLGKGDKERLVPLGRPAAEAVRRYLALGRPHLDRRYRPELFLNARGGP